MINVYETEDGVVFDMSNLECEALRSYADGLLADPEHPFVELLRGQGLVVGDTPVPRLAALLQAFSQATKVLTAWVVSPAGCRRSTFFVGPHSAVVSRCDEGGLYAGEDDLLSVWSIDSAQLRETFFELSALGEPSGARLCRRRYRRCSLTPSSGVMPRRFVWRYRRLPARLPT